MPATRNLTILFTDIVGYTERTASQSRAEHTALLAEHDRLLHPLIGRFHGTLVKSMGDGMLVSFASATAALHCAMAMQDTLARHNRSVPEQQQIQLRIGLAAGDVQVSQGDVFGEAVNIASRIERITPPGGIYCSASVYLAMNKVEVAAELVASQALKGIPAPVDIYRVLPMGEDGAFLPEGSGPGVLGHGGSPWHARWHGLQLAVRRRLRRPWWRVMVAAGLLVWLGIMLWPQLPESGSDKRKAQPPATEKPPATEAVGDSAAMPAQHASPVTQSQDSASEQEAPAARLLARGHLAFARKQREAGIESYREALERTPALAANRRLAANLVSALGWETGPARQLLERHASPAMVDALAARSGQPGYWGRLHATQVLAITGHGDRVQRVEAALLDLKEATDCERRRDAVRRLGELGDPRALVVLRPLAEMSLLRRFTSPSACLADDARDAVARIEGADNARP